MNKWVKNVLYAFGILAVLSVTGTITSEYQGKFTLKKTCRDGVSLEEFGEIYGEPLYVYESWENLPYPYRQELGKYLEGEKTYLSYQMEALPSNWSFVVSVDESKMIGRYLIWDAIALEPL